MDAIEYLTRKQGLFGELLGTTEDMARAASAMDLERIESLQDRRDSIIRNIQSLDDQSDFRPDAPHSPQVVILAHALRETVRKISDLNDGLKINLLNKAQTMDSDAKQAAAARKYVRAGALG